METKNKIRKKYHPVWIAALVLGTLLLFILMLAFLPKIYDCCILGGESLSAGGWEGPVVLGMFLGYVIGYVVVWINRFLGGLIMLLTALGEMATFLIIQGNTGSLIFGIPMAVIGILFMIAHYYRKQVGGVN